MAGRANGWVLKLGYWASFNKTRITNTVFRLRKIHAQERMKRTNFIKNLGPLGGIVILSQFYRAHEPQGLTPLFYSHFIPSSHIFINITLYILPLSTRSISISIWGRWKRPKTMYLSRSHTSATIHYHSEQSLIPLILKALNKISSDQRFIYYS